MINTLSDLFCSFTFLLNNVILIVCISLMFVATYRCPNIKVIKYTMITLSISYTLLIGSYMFILSWAPTLLIKYSKLADFTRYKSLNLSSNNVMLYNFLPYLLIILFAINIFALCKYIQAKTEFLNQDIHILRTIDAATVTSRIFCHYMKNELLALSAEVEEIEPSPTNTPIIKSVLSRCDTLYERLNHIHKSTSDATLNLMKQDIYSCIQNAINTVCNTNKLDNIQIIYSPLDSECMALIDTYYLEQSLVNMLFNAADALSKTTKEYRYIHIAVSQDSKWIKLSIKDNGIGIKSEDLDRIFTPFYSTNPITQNWGIGLSLSYKIITAHEGKLSVQSEYGIGTTFEILLPNTIF